MSQGAPSYMFEGSRFSFLVGVPTSVSHFFIFVKLWFFGLLEGGGGGGIKGQKIAQNEK